MVKPLDFHSIWSSPDNSRLTAKQYSFRLPVHVAAKLAALCEMYPLRSRTELVGDLLSSALDSLEQSLPIHEGKLIYDDPEEGPIHDAYGPRVQFHEIAQKHFEAMERDLGNENPPKLFFPVRPSSPDD